MKFHPNWFGGNLCPIINMGYGIYGSCSLFLIKNY
jgi:hypothetical protein